MEEPSDHDVESARPPERTTTIPSTAPTDRSVDVTDGRLLGPIVVLSAPIVISYLLDVVYYVVDLYWIGYLGTDAVAAMSYSWPVIFLIISLGLGITTAGTVLVGRTKGANRPDRSRHVAGQTVALVTLLSVGFAVAGYVIAPALLALIGATPGTDPHALAVEYTRISFLGLTPVFWFFVFDSIARGWGDTRTPLYLMAASVGVNLVIDPVFIHGFDGNSVFGWFGLEPVASALYLTTGFEGWGVAGAAIATVLSRAMAGGVGLYLLFTGGIGIELRTADLALDRATVRQITAIGVPTSVEMGLRASGIAVLVAIVAIAGDAAVAAYGIAEYLAALVFLPALGLARGTETIVAQNLGAEQVDRARHAVYLAGGMVVVVLVVLVGVAYPHAESIISLFLTGGTDGDTMREVVRIGAAYVWIVGPAYVFYGLFQVVLGAFRGSGHTRLAMVYSVAEMWLLRIPLCLVLLWWLELGMVGAWYAFTLSFVLSTVLASGWFFRGKWTTPVGIA